MKMHHYCNCELRCPECIRRFWKWAENHTRARAPKTGVAGPSFYEAATRRVESPKKNPTV
jgi:hypothetical protein